MDHLGPSHRPKVSPGVSHRSFGGSGGSSKYKSCRILRGSGCSAAFVGDLKVS